LIQNGANALNCRLPKPLHEAADAFANPTTLINHLGQTVLTYAKPTSCGWRRFLSAVLLLYIVA